MKRWTLGILVFILVLLIGGVLCLYQFGGLRSFVRVLRVINTMEPQDKKEKAWEEFSGTDPKGAQRGILAGSALGRVWVWTAKGLKYFVVDENTIYSWFDGCNEEVRAKLNSGAANVIERVLDNDLKSWRKKAQIGDYVVVYVARPKEGGVTGNLREIYTYNFWLFMGKVIDIECAK